MIKLGLVAHTVAMFSFVTIPAAAKLNLQSLSYVEYRRFPGEYRQFPGGVLPPGPLRYQVVVNYEPPETYFRSMFPLNQWLADGFLVGSVSNSRLGT